MTDLASLFQAFLAGDDAAFAPLYREVNPRLAAYCHKLAAGNAEDLMQELWERVIKMRTPSFSRRGQGVVDSPMAFLFRMVKNLAIDEFRRRTNEVSLEEDVTNGSDGTYPSHRTHPSDDAEFEHTTDIECIILEALEKLSAEDRELLVLNIYSGYNFGEIAEMLGTSAEAVWQRASRARVKLRKIVIEDAKRLGVALPRESGNAARKKEVIL